MKFHTSLQIINGSYRGIMPFRLTERPTQQTRTGESRPLTWFTPPGYGKARGSYTEKLRTSLLKWVAEKYGSPYTPIKFSYRLNRHKIISVIGTRPVIRHHPDYGNGKRGFILEIDVQSIDGLSYRKPFGMKITQFAWNRIVASDILLYLTEGNK